MRILNDGKLLINSTSNNENGRLQVYGSKTLVSDIPQGLLQVTDTNSQAQGVGGGINFTGAYLDSGTQTSFASIEAYKENGIFLWDIAAGAAIVEAAGGKISISNLEPDFRVDANFTNKNLEK